MRIGRIIIGVLLLGVVPLLVADFVLRPKNNMQRLDCDPTRISPLGQQITEPFTFTGKLVDSWGQVLPERDISFYWMNESTCCADCMSWPEFVAATKTDKDGIFSVAIKPEILKTIYDTHLFMEIDFDNLLTYSSPQFSPRGILLTNKYEETVIITMRTALLEGRISDELWNSLDLTGEIASAGWWKDVWEGKRGDMITLEARPHKYARWASGKDLREVVEGYAFSRQLNLKQDKTFSGILPPDVYDLYLVMWVKENASPKSILIGKDIKLLEMEKKSMVLSEALDQKDAKPRSIGQGGNR